jgi:integrase
MGLLEFIRGMGDGPLFYEATDKGKPLTEAQRRSRASEAANRVTRWIKHELGLEVYRPNHAWRHLFTTRSRQCDPMMDKETRDYMLGSRSKVVDVRESYGKWTPDVTDREINRQVRFAVVDTGERPYGE